MLPVGARVLQGPSMAAVVPVPAPGPYAVQLFFSEIYFRSDGQRVFDMDIAGLPALSCFDVYYAAGGLDHGLVATFLVRPESACWLRDARPNDGTLTFVDTYQLADDARGPELPA